MKHTIRGRKGSHTRMVAGACSALAAAALITGVGGSGVASAQSDALGKHVLPITGLVGPAGVAADNKGNVYVADTDGDKVVHYDKNGLQTTLRSDIDAYDVEVKNGQVYASDTAGNAVWKMDQKGNWTKLFDITGPLGLAVSGNTVYVVSGGSAGGPIFGGGNSVHSFSLNNKNAAPVDITWTTTSSLRDVEVFCGNSYLAEASCGNLYVSDDITNTIYGRDKNGNVSEILPGELGTDASVTGMDASKDQLFVADAWLDTVYVLDTSYRGTTLAVNNTVDAWDTAVVTGARNSRKVYIADRARGEIVVFERN